MHPDNLIEAEKMLYEIGANDIWTIHGSTHAVLTFVKDSHQMMVPFTDGGTLLVAYFPPTAPPA